MTLSAKAHLAVREIDDLIDRECVPDKMSPQQAIEFLEEIRSNIDGKIEVLKEENNL